MVGISSRLPIQSNFLKIINKNFSSIDNDAKETYILGDFNINMYENSKYIIIKEIYESLKDLKVMMFTST